MTRTITISDGRLNRVPQPQVVSENPLEVEIEFPEIRASVSMLIEGEGQDEQAIIKFKDGLVNVLAQFMNGETDYEYGAAIIESIRRLSTVISERRRVNHQGTLLHM